MAVKKIQKTVTINNKQKKWGRVLGVGGPTLLSATLRLVTPWWDACRN